MSRSDAGQHFGRLQSDPIGRTRSGGSAAAPPLDALRTAASAPLQQPCSDLRCRAGCWCGCWCGCLDPYQQHRLRLNGSCVSGSSRCCRIQQAALADGGEGCCSQTTTAIPDHVSVCYFWAGCATDSAACRLKNQPISSCCSLVPNVGNLPGSCYHPSTTHQLCSTNKPSSL